MYNHKSQTKVIYKLLNHPVLGKCFHFKHLSRVDSISHFCLCCKGCDLHLYSDTKEKSTSTEVFLLQVITLTWTKTALSV